MSRPRKDTAKKARITLRLTSQEADEVLQTAKDLGIPHSDLVRNAIKKELRSIKRRAARKAETANEQHN